ncbi:MAG: hypothetical protein JSU87_11720 [Gemmatimonadota bacterium]|nr:MAG: hypothetical protein JSU87_11720 [Gemmatimonadota bacterium]
MNTLSDPMRGRAKLARQIGLSIGLAALAVLVLFASQFKKLDHDEHQFIASAALLIKNGLFPWLDYPYFHVPYLLVPYALLFQLTDHLLIAARAFSAFCSLIMLGLIAVYASGWFKGDDARIRVGVAAGSAIMLAGSPSFTYTSGLAWNHDASVLLSVAAALVFLSRGRSPQLKNFVSGTLLGLAIGTRLTVLPLVAPFLAACFLLREGDRPLRQSILALATFGSGLLLALVPLFVILAAAPDEFIFGNFGYPALNTLYREASGYSRAMSLPLKILFFLERVLADPGNLIIYAFLIFVLIRIGAKLVIRVQDRELSFLLALIVFSFAGSLAPTPSFKQYFYAPLPFIVLAGIRGMALLRDRAEWKQVQRLFVAALVICFLRGAVGYWAIFQPGTSKSAVTAQAHRLGREVSQAVGDGGILTLSPIIPLEGGLDIYEEFVTGPFAWRVAALLAPEERERKRMTSPAELGSLLRERPPAGILLGLEIDDLEQPLLDFARATGYQALSLSGGVKLWLPTDPGHGEDQR